MRRLMCALATAAFTSTLLAQTPVITENTPVDTPTLHAWLHSGDPRLVAWAALFAERTHDAVILGEMPSVLEGMVLPSSHNEASLAPRRAAIALLDALIVEKSAVPLNTIEVISDTLPAQALILIERMPLSQSREVLSRWSGDNPSGWGSHQLARVATMLLAKDPRGAFTWRSGSPQSVVAAVTSAAQEQLTVVVTSTGGYAYGNGLGSGGCGDAVGHAVTLGWPEVYTYDLAESQQAVAGTTLVELAGDRIYWQRYKENGGWGSCDSVQPLNASKRHRLLAYWLGVTPQQMTWQPQKTEGIVWSDKAAYEQQLGTLVDAERIKLRGTADALRARGLLTDKEDAVPGLRVAVDCRLNPCPID